ncbi:N-acetyltransferase family protein [Jannaschia sp. 2305UL9-9]|uniref:GNAT family N-acetyltransferase n=1 Tax=Jannaschia sp. 2305UL9-9 TaxID=3121638 RepID=UPI00352718CD
MRVATSADRPAIVALHLASWQSTYGIELSDAVLRDVLPGYLSDKWAARSFGSDQITLLAFDGDRLAGFVCALTDRPIPLIDNLHVAPPLRGGGLGARLLKGVNAALAERGFRRSDLTVLSRNTRAYAFYLAQGGEDEGEEEDMLVGTPVRVRRIGFDLT